MIEDCPVEVRLQKCGAIKACFPEDGALELSLHKESSLEVRLVEGGSLEMRPVEDRTFEVCPVEDGTFEVRLILVPRTAYKDEPSQIGTSEIEPRPVSVLGDVPSP